MYSLVFVLFSISIPIQKLDSGYYYFGNTNVIGVGMIEQGEKIGEWKVYSKINPDAFPKNSLLQADPNEFSKDFRREFPLFVMNFEMGIPNGPYLENYPDGKPKVISYLKEGIFEGEFKEFYEGGELRMTGMVLDGKKDGEWEEYLDSGEVKTLLSYSQGVLEGRSLGYYPDSQINWEASFKRGELDGPFVYYLPDSTLGQKGQFANGIRLGEWQERLEIIPAFYRKGNYKNGVKEGEWQLLSLEGEFLQTEEYEQGKLISLGEFQTSPNVSGKGKVKNGRGERSFYDEKGNILAKGKIAKGTENGTWFFYFPGSNRITASGKLEDSERVGTWNFYSYDGEIIDQVKYEKYSQLPDGQISENNQQLVRDQRYISGITGSPSLSPFNSMQLNLNRMGQYLK
jgi:antitoxin component YwqK of YwqJK toxin-antitoxin module